MKLLSPLLEIVLKTFGRGSKLLLSGALLCNTMAPAT